MSDTPSNGELIRQLPGLKQHGKELIAQIADGARKDADGQSFLSDALYQNLSLDVFDVRFVQAKLDQDGQNRRDGVIPVDGSPMDAARVGVQALKHDVDNTARNLISTVADSNGALNGQLAELVGDRLSRKELDGFLALYAQGEKKIMDAAAGTAPINGLDEGQKLEDAALKKLLPAVEQGVEASIDTARPEPQRTPTQQPMKTIQLATR